MSRLTVSGALTLTLTIILLAAGVAWPPQHSAAASGFSATYAGESAFLILAQGEVGGFTVFFENSGSLSWVRGSSTQVDLAACRDDKVTCDAQDPAEALFNNHWLSPMRYATHAQPTVAPGGIATFSYQIRVPSVAAIASYRFNGDLVVSLTGELVAPQGYYQEVQVAAPPDGISGAVTASDTRAPLQFVNVVATIQTDQGSGTSVASTTTDALGEYVLPLPDGTYRISFRPAPDSPWAISYWRDGTSFLSGTDVVVRGAHITGINMALRRGHTIKGTIRSATTGAGLADQIAVAYFGGTENCGQFAFVASARSSTSGEYAFILRPGTYRILFQGNPASAYRSQWWKEVSDCSHATPVTLAGEPTPTRITIVRGIDARMSPP